MQRTEKVALISHIDLRLMPHTYCSLDFNQLGDWSEMITGGVHNKITCDRALLKKGSILPAIYTASSSNANYFLRFWLFYIIWHCYAHVWEPYILQQTKNSPGTEIQVPRGKEWEWRKVGRPHNLSKWLSPPPPLVIISDQSPSWLKTKVSLLPNLFLF